MKKTFIFLGILLGLSVNAQSWNLTGNSGTNPSTNFIGTTDNKDLVFKTNNSPRIKIDGYGRLGIGYFGYINPSYINTFQGNDIFYVYEDENAFVIYNEDHNTKAIKVDSEFDNIFLQEDGGKVIIGSRNRLYACTTCTGYRLFVKDGIKTEKVKVEIANVNGWADYVFEKEYKLMPLNQVKSFIKENKHLPEVPTAKEVVENGLELKEFSALLLKKVEELTLHVIQLNDTIEQQNQRIKDLEIKKQ